ncbi:hypothetical protein SNEBB_005869 [Seison nebaliae]|nr:hypothetical protein SNEBB_005869 [Seison nebaliae]
MTSSNEYADVSTSSFRDLSNETELDTDNSHISNISKILMNKRKKFFKSEPNLFQNIDLDKRNSYEKLIEMSRKYVTSPLCFDSENNTSSDYKNVSTDGFDCKDNSKSFDSENELQIERKLLKEKVKEMKNKLMEKEKTIEGQKQIIEEKSKSVVNLEEMINRMFLEDEVRNDKLDKSNDEDEGKIKRLIKDLEESKNELKEEKERNDYEKKKNVKKLVELEEIWYERLVEERGEESSRKMKLENLNKRNEDLLNNLKEVRLDKEKFMMLNDKLGDENEMFKKKLLNLEDDIHENLNRLNENENNYKERIFHLRNELRTSEKERSRSEEQICILENRLSKINLWKFGTTTNYGGIPLEKTSSQIIPNSNNENHIRRHRSHSLTFESGESRLSSLINDGDDKDCQLNQTEGNRIFLDEFKLCYLLKIIHNLILTSDNENEENIGESNEFSLSSLFDEIPNDKYSENGTYEEILKKIFRLNWFDKNFSLKLWKGENQSNLISALMKYKKSSVFIFLTFRHLIQLFNKEKRTNDSMRNTIDNLEKQITSNKMNEDEERRFVEDEKDSFHDIVDSEELCSLIDSTTFDNVNSTVIINQNEWNEKDKFFPQFTFKERRRIVQLENEVNNLRVDLQICQQTNDELQDNLQKINDKFTGKVRKIKKDKDMIISQFESVKRLLNKNELDGDITEMVDEKPIRDFHILNLNKLYFLLNTALNILCKEDEENRIENYEKILEIEGKSEQLSFGVNLKKNENLEFSIIDHLNTVQKLVGGNHEQFNKEKYEIVMNELENNAKLLNKIHKSNLYKKLKNLELVNEKKENEILELNDQLKLLNEINEKFNVNILESCDLTIVSDEDIDDQNRSGKLMELNILLEEKVEGLLELNGKIVKEKEQLEERVNKLDDLQNLFQNFLIDLERKLDNSLTFCREGRNLNFQQRIAWIIEKVNNFNEENDGIYFSNEEYEKALDQLKLVHNLILKSSTQDIKEDNGDSLLKIIHELHQLTEEGNFSIMDSYDESNYLQIISKNENIQSPIMSNDNEKLKNLEEDYSFLRKLFDEKEERLLSEMEKFEEKEQKYQNLIRSIINEEDQNEYDQLRNFDELSKFVSDQIKEMRRKIEELKKITEQKNGELCVTSKKITENNEELSLIKLKLEKRDNELSIIKNQMNELEKEFKLKTEQYSEGIKNNSRLIKKLQELNSEVESMETTLGKEKEKLQIEIDELQESLKLSQQKLDNVMNENIKLEENERKHLREIGSLNGENYRNDLLLEENENTIRIIEEAMKSDAVEHEKLLNDTNERWKRSSDMLKELLNEEKLKYNEELENRQMMEKNLEENIRQVSELESELRQQKERNDKVISKMKVKFSEENEQIMKMMQNFMKVNFPNELFHEKENSFISLKFGKCGELINPKINLSDLIQMNNHLIMKHIENFKGNLNELETLKKSLLSSLTAERSKTDKLLIEIKRLEVDAEILNQNYESEIDAKQNELTTLRKNYGKLGELYETLKEENYSMENNLRREIHQIKISQHNSEKEDEFRRRLESSLTQETKKCQKMKIDYEHEVDELKKELKANRNFVNDLTELKCRIKHEIIQLNKMVPVELLYETRMDKKPQQMDSTIKSSLIQSDLYKICKLRNEFREILDNINELRLKIRKLSDRMIQVETKLNIVPENEVICQKSKSHLDEYSIVQKYLRSARFEQNILYIFRSLKVHSPFVVELTRIENIQILIRRKHRFRTTCRAIIIIFRMRYLIKRFNRKKKMTYNQIFGNDDDKNHYLIPLNKNMKFIVLLLSLISIHHVHSECDDDIRPCQNGGTCTSGECKCTDSYDGDYCDIRVISGKIVENIEKLVQDRLNGKIECGEPVIQPNLSPGRIVNGDDATKHSWPWTVLLNGEEIFHGYKRIRQCAGTIITKEWIVTAAHCLKEGVKWWSLSGVHNRKTALRDDHVQAIKVAKIISNPEYKNYMNDIALMKLSEPLVFNDYVRPICLPNDEDPKNLKVTEPVAVVGWGHTNNTGSNNILQQIVVPVRASTQCLIRMNENMFCAGSPNSNGKAKDACQGDSGGPLVWMNEKRKKWVLHGVVSSGYKCIGYGIYTKVPNFVSWINSVLTKNG